MNFASVDTELNGKTAVDTNQWFSYNTTTSNVEGIYNA